MNRRKALKSLLSVIPATATIRVLDAAPGDVIVITFPGQVSMVTAERIKQVAEERFSEFRFMVLGDGGQVSVLRQQHAKEHTT